MGELTLTLPVNIKGSKLTKSWREGRDPVAITRKLTYFQAKGT